MSFFAAGSSLFLADQKTKTGNFLYTVEKMKQRGTDSGMPDEAERRYAILKTEGVSEQATKRKRSSPISTYSNIHPLPHGSLKARLIHLRKKIQDSSWRKQIICYCLNVGVPSQLIG